MHMINFRDTCESYLNSHVLLKSGTQGTEGVFLGCLLANHVPFNEDSKL